jgi:hypothetical protein
LRVFISDEQTKETDEKVGYLFLSELQNFIGGGNRFVTESIYGMTLCERQIPSPVRDGMSVEKYSVSDTEGLSRKAYPVVIARRNDEAIQLLSAFSGLLHFVRNDESNLSRQPRYPYAVPPTCHP